MNFNLIREFVVYSELISAIIGTIYLFKYKHTVLKYFLLLLWYITLTELFGGYMVKSKFLVYIDENGLIYNWWIHNIRRFFTFLVLYYIYYRLLKTEAYKKWVKVFAIFFAIIYILNYIFLQDFIKEIPEIPQVLGSIFLIISILFYFIELLKSEKIMVFHRLLPFWISVGLILFYAGTIPFMLKWNGYMLIPGVHDLFLIVYILAITMYLIFSFGFIWSKKE